MKDNSSCSPIAVGIIGAVNEKAFTLLSGCPRWRRGDHAARQYTQCPSVVLWYFNAWDVMNAVVIGMVGTPFKAVIECTTSSVQAYNLSFDSSIASFC